MNRNRSWNPHPPFRTARAVNTHFLGKSTEDVKLTLPAALKRDLDALAAQTGQPLSDYLRGVLARQLLGEGHYRRWQGELARIEQETGTNKREKGDGGIHSYSLRPL
jgi:hypothetical protein